MSDAFKPASLTDAMASVASQKEMSGQPRIAPPPYQVFGTEEERAREVARNIAMWERLEKETEDDGA